MTTKITNSHLKNIFILGSEGSLGASLVDNLLNLNFKNLFLIDKNPHTKFTNQNYFQADFCEAKSTEAVANFINQNLAQDNILISTIGVFGKNYDADFCDYSQTHQTLQINLLSHVEICQNIAYFCKKSQKKMRFVLVGSTAGNVGSYDLGYGISKAGLNGLVVGLSKIFARHLITAIGVNPGIFESKMSSAVDPERSKSTIAQTHLKRIGYLQEITNVVLYASLDAPDYLTGTLINVNGGQYR
jgi:3-oxoacyl-[acyl-carrier protein] reductase